MRWISAIHNIYTTLTTDTYSPAQQAAFPQTAPQRKLSPNLRDKVRYVVHYRYLELYLQVTRIHRVLTVKQSTWLKTCIDFNTHQHSVVGSSFLRDFFTLMNNSVIGNTQENLRKRPQFELITDCLTAIHCTVARLTPNRPIFVGFPCSTCRSCTCTTFTTITCA